MRVLVFTDEYDSGQYTFIYNEIKKLEQAGLEVYVVCERIGKLRPEDDQYSCIPLPANKFWRSFFWWANHRKFYSFLSLYPFFAKRKKIIENFKPDLVHIHFGDTATRLYPVLENQLQQYPVLVHFHGFDASSWLRRSGYAEKLKILIQKGVYSIYVSKALQNNLQNSGVDVNDQNSFLLYYGIDVSMFKRMPRPENKVRVFLQISYFNEKKGHIYTLKAFKQFLEKNPGKARLILGGDGPLKKALVEECRIMGLDDAVSFPGWISRDAAVSLFNEADCFVHHSITGEDGDQEGLPNSILEAMAMELPILSTWHSGIPELVTNEVNGLLVGEKEIEQYAVCMGKIIDWPALPANRKKVEEQFSFETHTRNLTHIYQKIVKSN